MDRRQFLGSAALATSLLPLAGTAGATASAHKRLLPAPLNKGDTVGLVSPSSASDDSFSLQLAREAMEALGFKVKAGPHLASRYGHLAGTDAERAGDLNAMFADSTVKAIVCVRGGSGAARLLPLLDYDAIRRNPKVLLGYSDITALHLAAQVKGWQSLHAPVLTESTLPEAALEEPTSPAPPLPPAGAGTSLCGKMRGHSDPSLSARSRPATLYIRSSSARRSSRPPSSMARTCS